MKIKKFVFPQPIIGFAVETDSGQIYEAVDSKPYTRQDGEPSSLITWLSQCTDCGQEFTFETGLASTFAFNRRCKAHRKPGIRVKHRDSFA